MNSSSSFEPPAKTIDDALAEYLRLSEAGKPFDRQAWLARYPQWTDDLRDFLANHDKMESFAGEMRRRRNSATAVSPFGTQIKYVGEYELLDELGQGGMGIVFKARQASLDRLVALKLLLDNSRDRDRFRAEAEAAASLDHPNLVTIYEVGDHEGWPYYTMQFIDGHDLRETVERGTMTPKRIAELLAALASAVQYAHDRGVLHRDLKPANVLIDKLGEPHITDFGLAKFVADATQVTQTQTGVILGTPSFMAPEQAAGDTRQVTVGTDVYGLGTILYALLAGQAPFTGDNSLAVLRQVESDVPVAPRSRRDNVPVDLETICLKCLEKIPRDRYRSAEALAEDLRRFTAGEPVLARPVGWLERSRRWCIRNPAIAGLAALVMAMLIGSSIGGMWMARNERQAHDIAESSRQREAAARVEAESTMVESFIANGLSARQRGDWTESLLWYATAADCSTSQAQRDLANVCVAVRMHQVGTPIRAGLFDAGQIRLLEFHPDSRFLLVGDEAGTTVLWDLHSDSAWKPLSANEPTTDAHFSADGKRVVFGTAAGDVVLLELRSGTRKSLGKLDQAVVSLATDPNARHIVAASRNEAMLFTRDEFTDDEFTDDEFTDDGATSENAAIQSWTPPDGSIAHVAMGPAVEHVVIQTTDGLAHVFAVKTWPKEKFEPLGAEYQLLRLDRPRPVRPQFVGSNRIVVFADQRVQVIDLETGEPAHEFAIGNSRLLAFDPKGTRLLNGGDRRARIRSIDGKDASSALHHRGFVVDGQFHPFRDEVAVGSWDRRVIVRHAQTTRKICILPHQGHVSRLAYAPSGELIATAQDDGLVRVLQLQPNLQSFARLPVPDGGSRAELLRDGVLFVGGVSRSSTIRKLQLLNPQTGERHGPAIALDGTLIHAAVSQSGDDVLALAKNQQNETELISASFADVAITHRAKIAGGQQVIALAQGAAVLTEFGDIHFLDEQLVENGRTSLGRPLRETKRLQPFAAQAHLVLVAQDDRAVVVDVAAQTAAALQVDSQVTSVCLSNDARLAAAGSDSGAIHIWSTETGDDETRITLPDRIYSLTFSPDNETVLVAAADGAARLFQLKTGEPVGKPMSHENDVFDAIYSPNGNFIYTIGDNGLVTVWDASDGSFIRFLGSTIGDRAKLPSDRQLWLTVSPNGERLLVCGLGPAATVHDVSAFAKPLPPVDTRRQRALLELISNEHIQNGTVLPITTMDWFDRWRDYRK